MENPRRIQIKNINWNQVNFNLLSRFTCVTYNDNILKLKGKKQKKNHSISSSELDSVREEEESETKILTDESDDDDVSIDVEEPSDESSENDDDDDDDDDDNDDDDDEDLNEQTQDILGKKRKRSNKKELLVNNHAVYEGASLMSYQILMDKDEQKQYFRNWTTEKIYETRDIDFAEWQKEHSTREAYFFGPDNVSLYKLNLIN